MVMEHIVKLNGFLLGLCAFAPTLAAAQWTPARPIRLVVGSVAGGGNDLVGRLLAQRLTESLRQQIGRASCRERV